jgi:FkbM family methyltransferase
MNTLTQIRAEFESGKLRKQEYIELIHNRHTALFNYPDFIKDTDVECLIIDPHGVFIRSRSQQIDLLLDSEDMHLVPNTLMNFRAYETEETQFLKSIINNNQCIIDIGANCGWYSLALAKHCPGAQVYAFEPIPRTYEILQRNITRNKFNNIFSYKIALSNTEGILNFLYTPQCSGATSLAMAGQPVALEHLQEIPCPSTTLDNFCTENKLSPQLIKCDVEGAELMVIEGGENTIVTHKPIILIELLRKWAKKFDYHPNDVINILKKHNYKAYTFSANGLIACDYITDETIETNFIFLHTQQHQHLCI